MLTGRKEYDEALKGVGEPFGPKEPVFILRATDAQAAVAAHYYAILLERVGASAEMVASVRQQAKAMTDWRVAEGITKEVPDLARKIADKATKAPAKGSTRAAAARKASDDSEAAPAEGA